MPSSTLRDGKVDVGGVSKAGVVDGIEAHRHPVETRFGEFLGMAGQRAPVRGHGDVADTVDRGYPLDELGDAVPEQRFTPGEADLLDAEPGEQRDEPLDLLEREDLISRAGTRGCGRTRHAACSRHSGSCSGP